MSKVTISEGNSKIGRIPNVSLPPVVSCPRGVPCAKQCYAMKAWRQYANCRKAWDGNLEFYKKDPCGYFAEIDAYLDKHPKLKRFRWHVAGDIVDGQYLQGMMNIATLHPKTRFLAFTKRYELLIGVLKVPENLTLVASAWPGHPMQDKVLEKFGVAWLWDAQNMDGRIVVGSQKCPGSCKTCAYCWTLKAGDNVIFEKH